MIDLEIMEERERENTIYIISSERNREIERKRERHEIEIY